jgi:hypothetical protein
MLWKYTESISGVAKGTEMRPPRSEIVGDAAGWSWFQHLLTSRVYTLGRLGDCSTDTGGLTHERSKFVKEEPHEKANFASAGAPGNDSVGTKPV